MAAGGLGRKLFVVASALLLGLSVTGWAASEYYLAGLSRVNVFDGLGGGPGWSGEPINILVVGSDDRSGLSTKQRSRHRTGQGDFGRHTDTMMLVHLGSDLDNVSVVSIPRDSLVTIPSHKDDDGKDVDEHRGKINSAFSTGGPSGVVDTVQRATGLTVDHYVEVNFKGFLDMVHAIGGVPVCLSEPLQDYNSGLDLPAGEQTIKGKQALAYVRARYIDNDLGRANRQQKFVSAMAQKVKHGGTLLNPLALNQFVDAAVSSVTTDERLTRDDIAALAARMADVQLGQIKFTTVPVSNGSHSFDGQSTVLWDEGEATRLFEALADDQAIPRPEKATPVDVPPGQIAVSVVGNDQMAGDLTGAGYDVQGASAGNGTDQTVVRYDPAWERSVETVRTSLPNAKFVAVPGFGGVFEVAAGSEYSGLHTVRAMSTSVESTVRSADTDICED